MIVISVVVVVPVHRPVDVFREAAMGMAMCLDPLEMVLDCLGHDRRMAGRGRNGPQRDGQPEYQGGGRAGDGPQGAHTVFSMLSDCSRRPFRTILFYPLRGDTRSV